MWQIFPVGVPLCYMALLLRARAAILSERPSQLCAATDFLHGSYRRSCYWWELMECSRKFLLLGVACVVVPGTLLQLVLGETIALVYLVLQMQARPFLALSDGFFAMGCSFCLVVFL